MIIIFRNFLVVALFLFVSFSCNSQSQNYTTAVEYFKNNPNFLFTQFDNNQLRGDLYLFNLKYKNSVKILSNVTKSSNPLILNSDLDLIMFADESPHRGYFYLIHTKDMIYKKLSLENKLDFVSYYNFINNFDCYSDGVIIFGFRNTIYTYSIISEKISVIKTFENIGIREVAFDNKTRNISFTYHNGIDTLNQKFLGIYILKNDSTILTNEAVISLGNFSEDGNKISFHSYYSKSGFYELNTNTIKYFSFSIDNQILSSAHFMNNNKLLLTSFNPDDLFHQDIYLYDLISMRVKEKLTDNNYGKSIIKSYRKQ